MNLTALIKPVQRALGVKDDGLAGVETWTAIHRKICGQTLVAVDERQEAAQVTSSRSEEKIATLHPRVQPYARALWHKARVRGISIEITSALRTYAEQDELYASGRTKKGPRVTGARGGYSNHNFGIAFDVTLFKKVNDAWVPVYESPVYAAIGALGIELGLEWGGNWHSLVDEPHFQLRPAWAAGMTEAAMLAELRDRRAAGKDAYE